MKQLSLWFVLALAALALSACVTYIQPTAAAAPAPEAARAEGALVNTTWLQENLDNPNVRVIEVSVKPGVYEDGHIPGAVNFVWHTDLVDTVRRDIVSPERFQAIVQAAGINDDTTIMLYGDNNNWFAAWGAWVFHLYGFDHVQLLDGGRAKWEAEGRPLSIDPATVAQGTATVSETARDVRAYLDDVLAIVNGEEAGLLLDIRSAKEYSGELFAPEGVVELSVRAGHIPGAINVPWGQNVNEDGTFKSLEELQALYAAVGVDGTQPLITYCRIGERAALTWFVLHQLLGYEAALYDGSWTEYGNTVAVPIENPAGTVWGKQ